MNDKDQRKKSPKDDIIKECLNNEEWFGGLGDEQKGVAFLIYKYHYNFSRKDSHYRRIVSFCKILVLALMMVSTIVLGMHNVLNSDTQVLVGHIISAVVTFVTAILSYFNFQEYWMRNIRVHIRLNILRDEFVLDAQAENLTSERIAYYKKELKELQNKNISYWERVIKK